MQKGLLERLDLAFPFNFWPFPGNMTNPDDLIVITALEDEYDSLAVS